MQLLELIRMARYHYNMYSSLTKKINTYIEEKFRVHINYHYAGEDVNPYPVEVNGVPVEYCVPVSIIHEKTEDDTIDTISEYYDLCILENKEVWLITDELYRDHKGELRIRKKYKKLGEVDK